MLADIALGAAFAFCFAVVCTPVGVSGAVFLVPVQTSVLEVPNPAVTPTNLLYNLIAIPGALLRFRAQGRLAGELLKPLILGTLPGVVAGSVIRVEWLAGPEAFFWVIAVVLTPLGAWLLSGRQPGGAGGDPDTPRYVIVALALVVGLIGGVYGIGGGSILGPILVGLGFTVVEVAPSALAATFLTSLAGVATFGLLSIGGDGDIAPEWLVGVGLGAGGLAGGVVGANLQGRVAEVRLRRGLGLLALVLGVRYAVLGLG